MTLEIAIMVIGIGTIIISHLLDLRVKETEKQLKEYEKRFEELDLEIRLLKMGQLNAK